MTSATNFTFAISDDLRKWVGDAAESWEISKAAVIRREIREFRAKKQAEALASFRPTTY